MPIFRTEDIQRLETTTSSQVSRNLWQWSLPSAPCVVDTFRVDGVADALQPHFRVFRTNFFLTQPCDQSWSRFPGIYSRHLEKLQAFSRLFDLWNVPATVEQELRDDEPKACAYPRGHLDSRVVICGIAPGWTAQPFFEAMWLLGPSSQRLASAVGGQLCYFTNVCKEAFKNNVYSDAVVEQWQETFLREIEIIQPETIIFLGKYRVYQQLQQQLSIHTHLVYHPSYVTRLPMLQQQRWSRDIQQQFHTAAIAPWQQTPAYHREQRQLRGQRIDVAWTLQFDALTG